MVSSLIMLHLYEKIPTESILLVKEKLKKLDKIGLAKIAIALPTIKLYNPSIVFWIGSILLGIFGIGRFMIGDKIIGFCKIALFLFTCLCLLGFNIFKQFSGFESLAFAFIIIAGISCICVVIWWIFDIFFITQKAKRKNLNQILRLFQV